MTTEERIEKLKNLVNATTATFGYIDLIQNPEPGPQIDREAALGKLHKNAERAMRLVQEVYFDALKEGRASTKTSG